MKKLNYFMLLLICCVVFIFTGCNDTNIVGTWRLSGYEGKYNDFEFNYTLEQASNFEFNESLDYNSATTEEIVQNAIAFRYQNNKDLILVFNNQGTFSYTLQDEHYEGTYSITGNIITTSIDEYARSEYLIDKDVIYVNLQIQSGSYIKEIYSKV